MRERLRRFARALSQNRPLAYLSAIAVTLLAVLTRHALDAAWGTSKPFMLFIPAIMIVARLGGLGPGLASTALSGIAIDFFWLEPSGSLHLPDRSHLAAFSVFLASGALISALCESLHAAMRRAARMHEARETLLAIVAHDLRNPLGAIAMNVAMLRRPNRTPDGNARALGTIERSVARMDRLIGDILDANKVEAGQVDVVLKQEPVAPLALEALEALAPSATAKQIELTSSVAAELPPIRCDRGRVLQVLGNLFGNAVKFTPEGGKIAFAVSQAGRFVQFVVTDSGPGIAASDVAHVFDRYWKKRSSGTGLGLYIVHGLVAAHGGRTWVESAPGRGSSVFVRLPIAR